MGMSDTPLDWASVFEAADKTIKKTTQWGHVPPPGVSNTEHRFTVVDIIGELSHELTPLEPGVYSLWIRVGNNAAGLLSTLPHFDFLPGQDTTRQVPLEKIGKLLRHTVFLDTRLHPKEVIVGVATQATRLIL